MNQRRWYTDVLDEDERAKLQELEKADLFISEALRQLERILASEGFKRIQENGRKFLGFVVAKRLLGKSDHIKETTVAIHAFDAPADFDTAVHTKVRVAAANLRQRLADYYAAEGQDEPIEIANPTGAYVPEIRDRRIVVTVSRFENWNPNANQDYLCTTVSDDIVHRLSHAPRFQARRVPTTELPNERNGYGLRGSLECRDHDTMRLNVSLSDLHAGRVIWDEAFEGRRDNLLRLSQRITTAIAAALQSEMAKGNKLHTPRTPPASEGRQPRRSRA
jgi:TolB-like protein